MNWQPIETAPKDGAIILLYNLNWKRPSTARWESDEERFRTGLLSAVFDPATHWCEIPELPTQ